MRFAIALVSCDRRQFGKVDYFDRTWASIRRSGFLEQMDDDRFFIFDAGPGHSRARELAKATGFSSLGAPDGLRLDVVRNMHRAFAWMCGADCEYGMLLTDDLLMCKNTLARAKQWVSDPSHAGVGLFSLLTGSSATIEPANIARGWMPYPYVGRFFGGLGAVIQRDVLLGYLLSDYRQLVECRSYWLDIALGEHMRSAGTTLLAHCPNLIHHIGRDSTLEHDYKPENERFPGQLYDALWRSPTFYSEITEAGREDMPADCVAREQAAMQVSTPHDVEKVTQDCVESGW